MSQFSRRSLLCAALAAAVWIFLQGSALAETKQVRMAEQFGMHYLPLQVMVRDKLIAKHAAKLGVEGVEVTLVKLGSGGAVNDALLSGSIDFAAGGTGPHLKLWDKSRGNIDVRAIAGLVCLPMRLNTNRPEVKSLKDLSEKDRIAVPAVKVSIQAVVLQMAAKKLYGDPNHFDSWTVSMKHPDATAALLSGQSHITAHFTVPPFSYVQTLNENIHTVASSYDIVGGKHTQLSLYNTKKFRDENPKVFQAVYNALEEANAIIAKDRKAAAALYIEVTGSKDDPALIEEILNDPDFEFTTTPKKVMEFATFLHEMGDLENMPKSWKDLYWETAHHLPGS